MGRVSSPDEGVSVIKIILIPLLFLFNCLGYVSGDLNSSHVSGTDESLKSVYLNIDQGGRFDYQYIGYFENIDPIENPAEATYHLNVKLGIPDEYEGGLCTIITIFSLGILPCYQSFPGTVGLVLKKQNQVVLENEVLFRFHVFYGWIFMGLFSFLPEDNQFGINEGTGISGGMHQVVKFRLGKRLIYLLNEDQKK
jgi:hypothetical protein